MKKCPGFRVFSIFILFLLVLHSLSGKRPSNVQTDPFLTSKMHIEIDDGDGTYFDFHAGKKYFFYQPSGGFGNQRYILRWAILVANSLNRTLVVSPLAPHSNFWHGYNEWSKEQIIPANAVLDQKALQHAVNRGVVFINDIPSRVVNRIKQEKPHLSVHVHVKVHWVNRFTKTKLLIYKESDIARLFGSDPADVLFWDKMSMWQCCIGDFPGDEAWYGRHIMFSRELKLLANSLLSSETYNAVHIRRGDMTSRDRSSALRYYRTYHLDEFDATLPLYIASNEKNLTWFQEIENRFDKVLFLKDLDQTKISTFLDRFPAAMRNDLLGFIEILICGNAKEWKGSRKSTFSAAIVAVRVSVQLRELEWTFEPKPSSGGKNEDFENELDTGVDFEGSENENEESENANNI